MPLPLAGFFASDTAAVRIGGWGEKRDAAAPEGHPAPAPPIPGFGRPFWGENLLSASLIPVAFIDPAQMLAEPPDRSLRLDGTCGRPA